MALPWRRAAGGAALLAALAAAGLAAAPRAGAAPLAPAAPAAPVPPAIAAKQAEARRVLAQVRSLDSQLGKAVERFNLASLRLEDVNRDLADNARRLTIARGNLRSAQSTLQRRLIELYTADDEHGDLAVLLGAQSLDEALTLLDSSAKVTAQDAIVIRQVRTFQTTVDARRRQLLLDRRAQAELVRKRAATRDFINGELARRTRLLASVRDEVARLEAAERARQERLRLEALARLAAQQEAERKAALERARKAAAELVARRAAARREADEAAAARARGQEPPPSTAALSPAEEQALQAQSSVVTRPGGAGATVPAGRPQVDGGVLAGAPGSSVFESELVQGPAEAPAAPPARYAGAVGIALRYLGVPYVWGGGSPSGFDCSGFSMYVYAQLGVSLPHHAASQFRLGTPVSRGELQPGDLVFFDGLGHMGIYIGGSQFVHAPHTGDVVKISSLDSDWYAARWVGARRL